MNKNFIRTGKSPNRKKRLNRSQDDEPEQRAQNDEP